MVRKRKVEWLLMLLFAFAAWSATEAPLTLSGDIVAMPKRPYYMPHEDWIGVALPVAPIEHLRQQLEKRLGRKLEHRNEAHLTVISQAEWRVLKQRMKMDDADKYVAKFGLQTMPIKMVCVKKVTMKMGKRSEKGWYISAKVPEMNQFRRELWRLFVARGGDPDEFEWERWKPHVAIGFTAKEFFDEDQVNRDDEPCSYPISLK